MCRGAAAAAAAGAAGEQIGEERGAPAGWGAQVQEQLGAVSRLGVQKRLVEEDNGFWRGEAITHAWLSSEDGRKDPKQGPGGRLTPGAVPRGLSSFQARGEAAAAHQRSSPSLSLSLSPCPPFASCLLWFQSRLQNTKLLLTFILQAFHHSWRNPHFLFIVASNLQRGREAAWSSFYIPPLLKKKKVSFLSTRLGWEKTNQLGLSPRAPGGLFLSVCVGCLVCFGFVSGGGLQDF